MYKAVETQHRVLHAAFDAFRDLKSSIQSASRTETTHELLGQFGYQARQCLLRFRESWLAATNQYLAEIEADHIKRGLGNSTLITSAKQKAHNECLTHLVAVEQEFSMLNAIIDSKRRNLDPAIA